MPTQPVIQAYINLSPFTDGHGRRLVLVDDGPAPQAAGDAVASPPDSAADLAELQRLIVEHDRPPVARAGGPSHGPGDRSDVTLGTLLAAAFGRIPWPHAVADAARTDPRVDVLMQAAAAAAKGLDWQTLLRIALEILQIVLPLIGG